MHRLADIKLGTSVAATRPGHHRTPTIDPKVKVRVCAGARKVPFSLARNDTRWVWVMVVWEAIMCAEVIVRMMPKTEFENFRAKTTCRHSSAKLTFTVYPSGISKPTL